MAEKANLVKRIVASFIDGAITGFLFLFLFVPGIIYLMIKDGLFEGRSIGKKLLGLKVVNMKSGKPCSFEESIIRSVFLGLVSPLVEFVLVILNPDGIRIGDRIANTRVVEA